MKKLSLLLLVGSCFLPHNILPNMQNFKKISMGVGACGAVVVSIVQSKLYSKNLENVGKIESVEKFENVEKVQIQDHKIQDHNFYNKNSFGTMDTMNAFVLKEKYKAKKTEGQIINSCLLNSIAVSSLDKTIALSTLQQMLQEYGQTNDICAAQVAEHVQSIVDAFAELKIMMGIAQEVTCVLVREDQDTVTYNPDQRSVYIGSSFFNEAPSVQLFALIHALTHCQQHIQQGSLAAAAIKLTMADEQQADLKALQAIACPVCLQIIQDKIASSSTCSQGGYLSDKDIISYKKTQSMQDICDAHKADTLQNKTLTKILPVSSESLNIFQKIWQGMLFYGNAEQRAELDRKIGTLSERLSTVKFF